MINLPTKILLAIKPMRTQFKFTLRLICTPEYKYTPEYIYTRVFFAHANWTLDYFAVYSRYNTDWIANTEIGLDPNKSVIKRLWCTLKLKLDVVMLNSSV